MTVVRFIFYGGVYIGSILMIFNIYGFIHYAHYIKGRKNWGKENIILNIPIILVILFFLGYVGVGLFGKPDLLVAGLLFGGSIFVFVMYQLLTIVTKRIIEAEQQEAELMAAQKSSRSKSDFLATMSHEMRTPLNVILGLDRAALRNGRLEPETRTYLEKIGHSGRYLLGIINNILDLNFIDSEKMAPKNLPFSLSDILNQISVIAQTLCDEKGLEYQLFTEVGFENCFIGDELLIKEILLCFIENAVKYTNVPGTVTFSVKHDALENDRYPLQFLVEDTGVGMDEEFLTRIWEPFTKEDESSTSRYGGSGLGLAAAKKKADLLNAEVFVKSKKGEGSVFGLRVSLLQKEAPSEKAAEAPEETPAGKPTEEVSQDTGEHITLEGRRILIVEDIPENAEITADLLDLEGAVSEHAENGQIALEMFSRAPVHYYDAILMDLRMPVMDGLEAARRIRELDHPEAKTIPILALTANTFDSDVQQTMEAGMNAHLVKPVDVDKMYMDLKYWISNHQGDFR